MKIITLFFLILFSLHYEIDASDSISEDSNADTLFNESQPKVKTVTPEKVESAPEIDTKPEKPEIISGKEESETKPAETAISTEIEEKVIQSDTLYDTFGRILIITTNRTVYYDTLMVQGNLHRIRKLETPIKKRLYAYKYVYEDDIFKKLGAFHIAMGSLSLASGIPALIIGIRGKSAPLSILSGIPILLGVVEISLGGSCLFHRKNFWELYKDRYKRIKTTMVKNSFKF